MHWFSRHPGAETGNRIERKDMMTTTAVAAGMTSMSNGFDWNVSMHLLCDVPCQIRTLLTCSALMQMIRISLMLFSHRRNGNTSLTFKVNKLDAGCIVCSEHMFCMHIICWNTTVWRTPVNDELGTMGWERICKYFIIIFRLKSTILNWDLSNTDTPTHTHTKTQTPFRNEIVIYFGVTTVKHLFANQVHLLLIDDILGAVTTHTNDPISRTMTFNWSHSTWTKSILL